MGGPGSGRKKGSGTKKTKSWAEMTHAEKVKASNKSKAEAKKAIKKAQAGKSSASNITWNSRPVRISGK